MTFSLLKFKTSRTYKVFCFFVAFTFFSSLCVLPNTASAQSAPNLPAPGTMIGLSPVYAPALVSGLIINPANPLQLGFIVDSGQDSLQGEALRAESQKLINYFLAALTVPEDEMWVNLSPYEKDRIIADGLGQTEMGRDMLVQDYLLKQLTASLMYPEEELGAAFWKRINEKASAKFGSIEIPTNTFNKVWIVPDEAAVYISGTNVFVNKSHLKVMLEEDYLALEGNAGSTKHGLGAMTPETIDTISEEAKEVIREIIIPEIEREVNEGQNFANLRQIYHSMILASWYKKNLRDSVLGSVYIDGNKVEGIDLKDARIKEKIYNQYIEAFKVGVYDYIKEEYDPRNQEIIPKKYFSGGLKNVDSAMLTRQERPSDSLVQRLGARTHHVVGAELAPRDVNGLVLDRPTRRDFFRRIAAGIGGAALLPQFGPLLAQNQPGFIMGGLNSPRVLENMTEINGVPLGELQTRLERSTINPLQDDLRQQLIEHNNYVLENGLTHQQLAEPMKLAIQFFNDGQPEFTYPKTNRTYRVSLPANIARGFETATFDDEGQLYGYETYIITDITGDTINNDTVLEVAAASIIRIEKVGYYGGKVSSARRRGKRASNAQRVPEAQRSPNELSPQRLHNFFFPEKKYNEGNNDEQPVQMDQNRIMTKKEILRKIQEFSPAQVGVELLEALGDGSLRFRVRSLGFTSILYFTTALAVHESDFYAAHIDPGNDNAVEYLRITEEGGVDTQLTTDQLPEEVRSQFIQTSSDQAMTALVHPDETTVKSVIRGQLVYIGLPKEVFLSDGGPLRIRMLRILEALYPNYGPYEIQQLSSHELEYGLDRTNVWIYFTEAPGSGIKIQFRPGATFEDLQHALSGAQGYFTTDQAMVGDGSRRDFLKTSLGIGLAAAGSRVFAQETPSVIMTSDAITARVQEIAAGSGETFAFYNSMQESISNPRPVETFAFIASESDGQLYIHVPRSQGGQFFTLTNLQRITTFEQQIYYAHIDENNDNRVTYSRIWITGVNEFGRLEPAFEDISIGQLPQAVRNDFLISNEDLGLGIYDQQLRNLFSKKDGQDVVSPEEVSVIKEDIRDKLGLSEDHDIRIMPETMIGRAAGDPNLQMGAITRNNKGDEIIRIVVSGKSLLSTPASSALSFVRLRINVSYPNAQGQNEILTEKKAYGDGLFVSNDTLNAIIISYFQVVEESGFSTKRLIGFVPATGQMIVMMRPGTYSTLESKRQNEIYIGEPGELTKVSGFSLEVTPADADPQALVFDSETYRFGGNEMVFDSQGVRMNGNEVFVFEADFAMTAAEAQTDTAMAASTRVESLIDFITSVSAEEQDKIIDEIVQLNAEVGNNIIEGQGTLTKEVVKGLLAGDTVGFNQIALNDKNEVVGFALGEKNTKEPTLFTVAFVGVKEGYRKKGIAKKLLNQLATNIKGLNSSVEFIVMNVYSENSLVREIITRNLNLSIYQEFNPPEDPDKTFIAYGVRINELIAKTASRGDSAMITAPGGIDFNPRAMNLQEQGEAVNFQMDNSPLQTLSPAAVHGIRPVIINITPVINFIPLLGLRDEEGIRRLSKLENLP